MVTRVEIDCSAWISACPELTDYRLEIFPPDNGLMYIADTKMFDGKIIWFITQNDTVYHGYNGKYQVVASGADGYSKTSDYAPLSVHPILDNSTPADPPAFAPTAAQKLMDSISVKALAAERAAIRAETAAKRADEIMADESFSWLPIASQTAAGTVRVGDNLTISDTGVLSVTTTDTVDKDNTKPITSAAVQSIVGNIEVILSTI